MLPLNKKVYSELLKLSREWGMHSVLRELEFILCDTRDVEMEVSPFNAASWEVMRGKVAEARDVAYRTPGADTPES